MKQNIGAAYEFLPFRDSDEDVAHLAEMVDEHLTTLEIKHVNEID